MNERMIQNALQRFRHQHSVIVPNINMAWGESDLLSVSRAGLIYDHEIKVSKQDFKADFDMRRATKWSKHRALGLGLTARQSLPNYFIYVAPNGLLTVHDVPMYAGLLHWHATTDPYHPFGRIELVKVAPLLHKTKITEKTMQQLARALMFRYWNLRQEHDPRCPGNDAQGLAHAQQPRREVA